MGHEYIHATYRRYLESVSVNLIGTFLCVWSPQQANSEDEINV